MTNTETATRTVYTETYRGHEIAITETDHPRRDYDGGGFSHAFTSKTAYIDGRGFRCPVGTNDQVAAKLRKSIDTWDADDAILPRLTAIIANVHPGEVVENPAVDDVVAIHAMGYYRVGLVTAVKRTRVEVAYTTASSGGRVFRKAVPHGEVRGV